MCKIFSEMAFEKGLWSEIVAPKNIFALQFTLFDRF